MKGSLLQGTLIHELSRSPLLSIFINGVLGAHADGRSAIVEETITLPEIVAGINIMRGPGDVSAFHFDGTFLNIVVPVFIPRIEGPNRGQLTIYPNIRSFRKNLYDRLVVPTLCRLNMFRVFKKPMEVDYKVGDIYLFYGYRSLHGVMSPSEAGLRCTTNITVGARHFL